MTNNDFCSYLIKSRCFAPTFEVNIKQSINKDVLTANSIDDLWKISYLEWNAQFFKYEKSEDLKNFDLRDAQQKITLDDLKHLSGGKMFDLQLTKVFETKEKKSEVYKYDMPAEVQANWMKQYRDLFTTYVNETMEGSKYWNNV